MCLWAALPKTLKVHKMKMVKAIKMKRFWYCLNINVFLCEKSDFEDDNSNVRVAHFQFIDERNKWVIWSIEQCFSQLVGRVGTPNIYISREKSFQ